MQGAGPAQDRFRAVFAPVARRLWPTTLTGLGDLPESGPAVICPNHISFLDSVLVMLHVPRRISFVGKAEYMDSWKTKHLFPAMGMIPIDRAGGERSQAALDAARRVLDRGELFGIFPEGTRSRDGVLHKGHTGAARLAIATGAPLVPVGVVGTREVQPPDAKAPKVGKPVELHFGRPIETARYAGREGDHRLLRRLTDEVMFEIRELSGQEYRDVYATKKPEGLPASPALPPLVAPPEGAEVSAAVAAGG